MFRFSPENGSGTGGAPVCAAGVIAPVAEPTASASPAVRVAGQGDARSAFECTRQLLAVIFEEPARLTSPAESMLSTQSGMRWRGVAVAWTLNCQPPGGRMSPKNDAR